MNQADHLSQLLTAMNIFLKHLLTRLYLWHRPVDPVRLDDLVLDSFLLRSAENQLQMLPIALFVTES